MARFGIVVLTAPTGGIRAPVSITPRTVVMLCVLVAVAGCARFAQSSNSPETDPSSAPTATATANQSLSLAIVAHGVDQIADPEATAIAYIVAQTHTDASDWKLLNKAVTDIGPYPDAAWSGKFYNDATKDDACVIVLADDQYLTARRRTSSASRLRRN